MKKLLTFLTLLTLSIGVSWADSYVKVTSDDDLTSGTYLIVCESQNVAFDGSLSTLDAVSNTISVTITNNEIAATSTTNASAFTIDVSAGTILSASGKYIGRTANSNGMNSGNSPYTNEISIESGNAFIKGSGGSVYLRYNKTSGQTRFRYFTSAQTMIQLYKYVGAQSVAKPTFSPAEGTYYEPQNVKINCSTSGATIYYTTNGSDPTTSSSVYSTPLAISTTTTIKAMAVKSGMNNSDVATSVYTINSPATVQVPPTYEETFSSEFGNFYTRNVTETNIWSIDATYHYAKASGRISSSNTDSESWLISPYIDLTNAANPQLLFTHAGNYFTDQNTMKSDVKVKIKKQGDTDWSDFTIDTWPDGNSWTWVDNTTSLSDYAGETVQIAFVYTSSTTRAGTWEIKNFKVRNVDASAPKYYLVGSFNGWQASDDYEFEESNGTYTLNNVNFPDANTTFKIIKVQNGTTWYGGTGDVVYNIHHRHHTNLPMNGSQNYTIQSAGSTSFSFTLDNNNNPINLNVNRTASLAIKGDFTNNWTEVPMTATADGWTTTQTTAVGNEFGFVDEFGQYIDIKWTVGTEHLGTNIPMTTDGGYEVGNYKMGIAGTYQFTANSDLTTLVITAITGDIYTLVVSANDLENGAQYVLMSKGLPTQGDAYAMAGQRSNNRGQTVDPIVISSNKEIIINGQLDADGNPVQVITLEGETGAWYFNVGNGYLYASSSTANNLKTEEEKDDNAKATIVIDETEKTSAIVFQGENTRNVLRHNASSKLFSCYESGQQPVYLFKKTGSVTPPTPTDQVATPDITPGSANSSNPYIVYGGKQQITISCTTEGATIYYTTNGETPTTSSTPYAEPCYLTSIGGNMTVKAIAVKDGLEDSEVATSYYRFTNPNPPTFNPASGTVHSEAFDVTISSEYNDAEIYYLLDPAGETAPTANQIYNDGNGNLYESPVNVSGEDAHTIYAIVVRNGIKSDVVYATYTISSGGGTTDDGDYVKVTSNDELTDGNYLIVYEIEGNPRIYGFLFNGSLNTLDASGNSYAGEDDFGVDIIENNSTRSIASSDEVDATIFTIDIENGSIMSASGKYIGASSNTNTITVSSDPLTNNISIDGNGNAVIVGSGGAILRYNSSDDRFRYYKTSSYASQQPIALYKKVDKPVEEPTEATLAEIEALGENADGKLYKISDVDGLLGVYKNGTSIWFKDEAQAVDYQDPTAAAYEYYTVVEKTLGINKSEKDFAQNNWIEVVFPSEKDFTNAYVRNLTGTYSFENGNPKLTLTAAVNEGEGGDVTEVPSSGLAYDLNPYMAANFVGNQTYTNNGETTTFFFSKPKAQEYALILWAVYAGNNQFNMPTDTDDNYYGFTGSFTINPQYNSYSISGLNPGDTYNFKAIIRKSASKAGSYEVYPTDLNPDVPTAINGVVVNGAVKSVKFYNVAGIESNVPFQGVNIVVTEFTDGTRTTTKMLKR